MPKKIIITTVTLAVSAEGTPPGENVAVYLPPGAEATLDADEADRILARWGGEIIAVIPDETPTAKDHKGKN